MKTIKRLIKTAIIIGLIPVILIALVFVTAFCSALYQVVTGNPSPITKGMEQYVIENQVETDDEFNRTYWEDK